MKKTWIWIVAAVAFVGLIIGAKYMMDWLADDADNDRLDDASADEEKYDPAPDFTVYDANGNEVKLSDMKGKPVVLNIWASWCGPCKNEMPGFQAMYEKYGEEVHFMMVNLTGQDSVENAKALIRDAGYTFPVYWDTDNSAAYQYTSGSVPVSFFINAKGQLVTYAIGAIPESTLEQGIGMIME